MDEDEKAQWGVGEYPYFSQWSNGALPQGATGQKPCGTQRDFDTPAVWPTSNPPLPLGASGLPTCCNNVMAMAFALGNPTIPITPPVFTGDLESGTSISPTGNFGMGISATVALTAFVSVLVVDNHTAPTVATTNHGVLTPVAVTPGPTHVGTQSVLATYAYQTDGTADNLTVTPSDGPGVVMVYWVGFTSVTGTNLGNVTGSGTGTTFRVDFPTRPNPIELLLTTFAYDGSVSTFAWQTPFNAFPHVEPHATFGGVVWSVAFGYFVTVNGSAISAIDIVTGANEWSGIGMRLQ